MRQALTALVAVAVLTIAACSQRDKIWFDGDYTAAAAAARERGTLMMLEFYADWCSWCERMEKDTFSDSEVQIELKEMVALKVNAEAGGEELAGRYGVDSYPTFVFTDSEGAEVDRILGYLPPADFIGQSQRIRAGDTFAACLQGLSEDPADEDAIMRAVVGLLERSDPEGAISRVKSFHGATDGHNHQLCQQLMFRARAALQSRVYDRAARLYRRHWDSSFVVPQTGGTMQLHALMREGLAELDPGDQAERLRMARFADAGVLLETLKLDTIPGEDLRDLGHFAFLNGHYDLAESVYARWFDEAGAAAEAEDLNSVAWQLYLSGRALDTAVEIAHLAYQREPSADIADTLARLLYRSGEVDHAILLQLRAAELSDGSTAEGYREAVKLMEAGQKLDDRPAFEFYPGIRFDLDGNPSRSVI
jgi:thioredoxin-related protein